MGKEIYKIFETAVKQYIFNIKLITIDSTDKYFMKEKSYLMYLQPLVKIVNGLPGSICVETRAAYWKPTFVII